MYHPINRINCPPLDKLNNIARLTLEFCLTQTLALSEEEIRDSFFRQFNVAPYDKVGEWLWGKTALIKPLVMRLIVLPVSEKQEIYSVYLQNQDLESRFIAGSFVAVSLPPVSKVAYDNAAELAGNFYNILCDGVPGEKIGELEQLNRQSVLRAYLDAQKSLPLKVCPGCDGKPPSVSDGIIHEDLDHFFPKSKYPFLSIHPLNLTPLCKDCNQTYKRSKDAIVDNAPIVSDVHCLNDIFHPYLRAGKNDLCIDLRNEDGKVGYNIECQTSEIPNPARLHSLQYVLEIESRWTGDLEEERIEEPLFGLLLHGSQPDRDQHFDPNMDWLNQQLASAIITLRYQQGRVPNYVSAYVYAQWISNNQDEKNHWLERVQQTLAQTATS